LFCFGEAQEAASSYAELFGCGQGQFPIWYLGIPIHYRRLTIAELKAVEERLQKCLSSWKGKLLSLGGRLVLINSVLSNMVLYMISFFLLPKGVLQKLDYYRSRFFWQGDSEKKKYRVVKWSVAYRPKDQGGLRVHDLQVKNSALLRKWLFKLLTEDGVWRTLVKRKYIGLKALSQVFWKHGDSHFWAGLMALKNFFLPSWYFINDGSQIQFWEDTWLDNVPLQDQYPALYSIVHYKSDTIAKVMATSPPAVSFRWDLLGNRLTTWNTLQQCLESIQLSPGPDESRWNLQTNGTFSVDPLYKAIMQSDVPVDNNKKIWKMKIPLKTKKIA
jgi:hypothetical protein